MLEIENRLYNEGYNFVCGVDEAGRGPLCGPVVAAAVILPKNEKIEGINDSKKLSEKKREQLFDVIKEKAIAVGVGIAAASIIAKVTRDRMLIEYDKKYPEYGFAKHKGYGTKVHIEAIQKYGLTDIHRPSFCKKFIK